MEQGTEIMYFTFKGMDNITSNDEITIWLDKIEKIIKYQSYSGGRTLYYLEISFCNNRSDLQFYWKSQSTRDEYNDRILKAMYTIYPNEENPRKNILTLKG